MKPEILEYIRGQRVDVLSVEMLDGSPHGATLHFAHSAGPLAFVFLTDREYRKSEALFGKDVTRASFVIGSSEENMKTLQLDGEAKLLDAGTEYLKEVYFDKFPDKREKFSGPEDFFFAFKPTWWRFTDWTRPGGKTVFISTESAI